MLLEVEYISMLNFFYVSLQSHAFRYMHVCLAYFIFFNYFSATTEKKTPSQEKKKLDQMIFFCCFVFCIACELGMVDLRHILVYYEPHPWCRL